MYQKERTGGWGGDWGMDRGKSTYGTYHEGGTGKEESLWNVNNEYKKIKKNIVLDTLNFFFKFICTLIRIGLNVFI